MEERRFKIGEVSRMLDISVQTLRFLETTGLISPEKDPWNHYRYYGIHDVDEIMQYKKLRQSGFSSAESVSLLQGASLQELDSRLLDKVEEARYAAIYLHEKVQKLENFHTMLSCAGQIIGRFLPMQSPENYALYMRQFTEKGVETSSAKELGESFQELTQHYSFVEHSYRVRLAWLMDLDGRVQADWGYTIKRRWVELLRIKAAPPLILMPARECLFTVIRSLDGAFLKDPFWQELPAAIRDLDEEVTGDICTIHLAKVKEDGFFYDYTEVWIPVTGKSSKSGPALGGDSDLMRRLKEVFTD